MRYRTDSQTETRADRASLGEPERTDEGYLVTEARIAVPGVLVYRLPGGGQRRELVPADTLADPQAIQSLRHKPVTMEHPAEPVGPHNVGSVEVGNVTEDVRVDESGALVARVVVRDQRALEAIEAGVREVSPGYDVALDMTPGIDPVHGPYDAIQVSRRYNHLAITRVARGGPSVRLRADAYDLRLDADNRPDEGHHREDHMNPLIAALIALGVAKETAEARFSEVEAAVQAKARQDAEDATARADALEAEVKTEREAKERLAARLDALGLDPDNDDHFDPDKRWDAWLAAHRERAKLEELAQSLHMDAKDLDLPTPKLRRAIVAAAKPDLDLEGRSDDYVTAAVEMLSIQEPARQDSWANAFSPSPRQDAEEPTFKTNPALAAYQAAHADRFAH